MSFGGLATYETARSRRAKRIHGRGWTRRVVFKNVPYATAESLVPAEYTPYPGETGKEAAVLIDSDVEQDWRPALSMVTLYYRPLTWEEWLEAHPNKGVLFADSGAKSDRVSIVDGNVLEGPDLTDGESKWVITSGTNVIFRSQGVYEIYAVINNSDYYFFQFVGAVGRWNLNIMNKFPLTPFASAAGQFLLTMLSRRPRQGTGRQFTLRARFQLDLDLWKNNVISTKFTQEVKKVTADDDTEQYILVWEPQTDTYSTQLVLGQNFSVLNSLLINSW